jgi:hypothetical protein
MRRPALAVVAAAVFARRVDRQVADAATSVAVTWRAVSGTAAGLGSALALLGPFAWWWAVRDRRAGLLLLGAVVAEWHERGRPGDLPDYAARALVDQAAYGAGVVSGCVRHRTLAPLMPRTGRSRER